MAKSQSRDWMRLDNVAKIFPSTSGKKETGVFRFSCDLKENIDAAALQKALELTVEEFPHFLYAVRSGLFWYYLEQSDLKPMVHVDDRPICAALYNRNKKSLLFDVSYYKNRINLEVYHVLADGTGAIQFLRTMVYYYLTAVHQMDLAGKKPHLDYQAEMEERSEDSFRKYYKKPKGMKMIFPPRAYKFPGKKPITHQYKVIEGQMSCSKLLELSEEKNTSLTVLLAVFLIQAMEKGMSEKKRKYPIVFNIPVDLRKKFPSSTARNFFGNIYLRYNLSEKSSDTEEIIESLSKDLKEELSDEKLQQRIGRMISTERNFFLRIFPLPLKNLFMQLGRFISEVGVTAVISNVGQVKISEELSPYVQQVAVVSSTRKMHFCLCTYGDILTITFTSPYENTEIQKHFFRTLTNLGIQVRIRSNM